MIKPISFLGKAYFLESALRTITPEQKKRIENYASKKEKDVDVVVMGSKKEFFYKYKNHIHLLDLQNTEYENGCFKINTKDGAKLIKKDDFEIIKRPIPIYNAYIIHHYNKEDVYLPHDKKEFDFINKAKSTIINHSNRIIDDIEY